MDSSSDGSDHQYLYKQSTFNTSNNSLSSIRQSIGRSVRSEQNKQRELFLTRKRFKVKSQQPVEEIFSDFEDQDLVEENVKLLKKGKKLQSLPILCSAFARRETNADIFLRCDGLQSLLACFQTSNVEVLQNAAWCAVNLTAGASDSSKLVVLAPTLIQFVQSSDPLMQELCAWSLGNIAGNSPSNASVLQNQGCIHALIQLISTRDHLSSHAMNESVLFALINFSQSSFACIVEMQEKSVFELIQTLLRTVKAESSLTFELAWLVDSIYSRKETFSSYPGQYPIVLRLICDKLREVLDLGGKQDNERVFLPLIHCLANAFGMDCQLARTLLESDAQAFTSFQSVLLCKVEVIQNEMLRALFNCMGDLCSRMLITLNPSLLQTILSMCHHSNKSIALQALDVVDIMTKTSTFVDTYLVNQGIITKLSPLNQPGTVDVAVANRVAAIFSNVGSSLQLFLRNAVTTKNALYPHISIHCILLSPPSSLRSFLILFIHLAILI